jgi:putative transposase
MNVEPGMHVTCGGEHYVITHLLSLDSILAKNQSSGKSESLSIADLSPYVPSPKDVPEDVKELSAITDEQWAEAESWYENIKSLFNVPSRTRTMVEEVAKKTGVSIATIYRKIAKWEQTELVSSLRPAKHTGGMGKSRLEEDREAILQRIIGTTYLNKQKPDLQHTYESLQQAFRSAGLRAPHKNTLRNRINSISQKEKDEARLGPDIAAKKHSAYPGHFPGGDFPLAVVQIDHTKFDVSLLDDRDREPIGRPWVTLMIDVFSRMVLGYYISLDPPNTMSAGLCIANAILTKENLLKKYDIKASWPCWGKMTKIHADNAGEFRGKMLRRACKEYGIDLEWRPVKKPRYGAHIERLLGTVLNKVHSLPGTTFSNIKERGKYDSEGNAIMTMSEFERWFLLYITGVYHQKIHSSLHRPPIKQYESGILGTDEIPGRGFPQKITDEDRLLLNVMPYEERTVQEYGIVIEYVYYFADVLRRWVNSRDPKNQSKRRKFIFKRHPNDISVVYFFDPEVNQYFRIPYRDTSHPPVSIWEFRRALKRLKDQGIEEVDEAMIFDSYAQMRAIEEKAAQETKHMRRERQRRENNQNISKPRTADNLVNNSREDSRTDDVDSYASIPAYEEREEL